MAVSTTMFLMRSSRWHSSKVWVETTKSYASQVAPDLSVSSWHPPRVCGTCHCIPPATLDPLASSHLSLWHTLTKTFRPVASSVVLTTKPAAGITSWTPFPYTDSTLFSYSSWRR